MITLKFNEITSVHCNNEDELVSAEHVFECEGIYAYSLTKIEGKLFSINYSLRNPDENVGVSNHIVYADDCIYIELNGEVIWEKNKKEVEEHVFKIKKIFQEF